MWSCIKYSYCFLRYCLFNTRVKFDLERLWYKSHNQLITQCVLCYHFDEAFQWHFSPSNTSNRFHKNDEQYSNCLFTSISTRVDVTMSIISWFTQKLCTLRFSKYSKHVTSAPGPIGKCLGTGMRRSILYPHNAMSAEMTIFRRHSLWEFYQDS